MSRRSLLGAAGALALGAPVVAGARVQEGRSQFPSMSTVRVFPSAGTWTASPYTEISFRGVTVETLGPVRVTGSQSGGHSGIEVPHADGNGVRYLPDARFELGELVTVTASVPLSELLGGAHTFGVAVPVDKVATPASVVTDAPEVEVHRFRSRPDLTPPVMEITTPATGSDDGYVFLTPKVPGGPSSLMILDTEGELVWCEPGHVDIDKHFDLRVQEHQGQQVITWVEASMAVGYGFGHFAIADASYQVIREFQSGNSSAGADVHEFVLTDRGTALVLLYHPVQWDATGAGGSRFGSVMDNIVQEVEVDTGRVLFEWHSLDHVAVEETFMPLDITSENPFDYFHVNSVNHTPDGNLIISARHTHAVYLIDYQTGEVIWRLNGRRSDFTMGEGTPFAWQHDAQIHPNGELTLFDNAERDRELDPVAWSRGMVLALDREAMTATLLREYVHPAEILSTSQANMQVLPNVNVFIGWGSAPVFSEFSPEGELVFNGRLPRGSQSYRAYRFPWVGEPIARPDVAVDSSATGSVTVYVSWNGATEVASWRVLAGPSPVELYEVVLAPRSGFETTIEVRTDAAYVAVEALDAGGAIIGASEAIAIEA